MEDVKGKMEGVVLDDFLYIWIRRIVMIPGSKIKEKLIDTIKNTEDDELLAQIVRLVEFESQVESVYDLNDAEIRAVNEGLDQLNKGQFITHEEANAEIDQWLKK